MADPTELTVTPLEADGYTDLPEPDEFTGPESAVILGADTGGKPGLVLLEVFSDCGAVLTVLAGDDPPASRAALGDLVLPVGGTPSMLSTNLSGNNNDLTFAATRPGSFGDTITIAYIDPSGNDKPLTIDVDGMDIEVSLATGPAGAITSTAAEIMEAINEDEDASALVTATLKLENDGSGVVTAMSATPLADGADATRLFGPFESARFAQDDGSLLIDIDMWDGGETLVRCYQMPRI